MSSVHGIQVVGGTFPAQIWRKFMLEALPGLESCDFPRPRLANLPSDDTTDSTLEDPDATSTTTPRSTTSWVPITLAPTTSTTSSTTTSTAPPTTPTTEPLPAAGRNAGP
jgi:membrane peptidoglycan carboxypeptidase